MKKYVDAQYLYNKADNVTGELHIYDVIHAPAAKVIPIDWIIKQIQEQSLGESKAFSKLLRLWEKENE